MAARFGVLLLIIFSALYLPIWSTLILTIAGFFLFPTFIEGILVLLALDFIYGTEQARFFNLPLVHFTIGLITFFLIAVVKKRMLVR